MPILRMKRRCGCRFGLPTQEQWGGPAGLGGKGPWSGNQEGKGQGPGRKEKRRMKEEEHM